MDLQRSLEISERMIEKVRGKRNILIVAHDNPDPDALAAAYALSHLFLVKTGQSAVIASGGIVGPPGKSHHGRQARNCRGADE